jgi:hypothetical protein
MQDRFGKTNDDKPFVQCSIDDLFCSASCIFKRDTKISYCAVQFRATQKKLNRAKVAGITVDQCGLCAPSVNSLAWPPKTWSHHTTMSDANECICPPEKVRTNLSAQYSLLGQVL